MLDEIASNFGFALIPKIWQIFQIFDLDKFIMHKPLNF